jgi:hypothetical protein
MSFVWTRYALAEGAAVTGATIVAGRAGNAAAIASTTRARFDAS